jgi:signal transduction histidine kinase
MLVVMRVSNRAGGVQIKVTDNGIGIRPEHIARIFTHGFTTKKDGHGFGLHSGALTARDLGGVLRVDSAGPGRGATFTLDLPLKLPETVYG